MKESELIVARFKREASRSDKSSEHIVDVFDVGADARVGLYMVMEHLDGEDLQTRLEREKRLDVATGVMIAAPDGARPREGARRRRHPSRPQAGQRLPHHARQRRRSS